MREQGNEGGSGPANTTNIKREVSSLNQSKVKNTKDDLTRRALSTGGRNGSLVEKAPAEKYNLAQTGQMTETRETRKAKACAMQCKNNAMLSRLGRKSKS